MFFSVVSLLAHNSIKGSTFTPIYTEKKPFLVTTISGYIFNTKTEWLVIWSIYQIVTDITQLKNDLQVAACSQERVRRSTFRLTVVELMPRLLSDSNTILFRFSTYTCSPAHRDADWRTELWKQRTVAQNKVKSLMLIIQIPQV